MVLLGGFTVAVPFPLVVPLLIPVVPEVPTEGAAAPPAPTAPAAAGLPVPAPAAKAIEELAARTEAKTIVVNFMCFPFR